MAFEQVQPDTGVTVDAAAGIEITGNRISNVGSEDGGGAIGAIDGVYSITGNEIQEVLVGIAVGPVEEGVKAARASRFRPRSTATRSPITLSAWFRPTTGSRVRSI